MTIASRTADKMWAIIESIMVSLLEKAGWRWWTTHKVKEANNVENKINSMSTADTDRELHKWERPD